MDIFNLSGWQRIRDGAWKFRKISALRVPLDRIKNEISSSRHFEISLFSPFLISSSNNSEQFRLQISENIRVPRASCASRIIMIIDFIVLDFPGIKLLKKRKRVYRSLPSRTKRILIMSVLLLPSRFSQSFFFPPFFISVFYLSLY